VEWLLEYPLSSDEEADTVVAISSFQDKVDRGEVFDDDVDGNSETTLRDVRLFRFFFVPDL
jgi:hypothetical protein